MQDLLQKKITVEDTNQDPQPKQSATATVSKRPEAENNTNEMENQEENQLVPHVEPNEKIQDQVINLPLQD